MGEKLKSPFGGTRMETVRLPEGGYEIIWENSEAASFGLSLRDKQGRATLARMVNEATRIPEHLGEKSGDLIVFPLGWREGILPFCSLVLDGDGSEECTEHIFGIKGGGHHRWPKHNTTTNIKAQHWQRVFGRRNYPLDWAVGLSDGSEFNTPALAEELQHLIPHLNIVRTMCVIRVNQLPYKGAWLPVRRGAKRLLGEPWELPYMYDPMLYIRAYSAPGRIGTVGMVEKVWEEGALTAELVQELFELVHLNMQAIESLSRKGRMAPFVRLSEKEMNGFKERDYATYIRWLAHAVGYNIGLLHGAGWVHGNIGPVSHISSDRSNTTLYGAIVDIDTAERNTNEAARQLDILGIDSRRRAMGAIPTLQQINRSLGVMDSFDKGGANGPVVDPKDIAAIFMQAYKIGLRETSETSVM